jgi:hypothetical protein
MKWLAVILVLLNLAAWLLGMKVDPGSAQLASAGQFEPINVAAMSVVQPTVAQKSTKAGSALEGVALEEENLAQLKMDKRGQVLMAPGSSIASRVPGTQGGQLTRVIMPNDRSKGSLEAASESTPVVAKVAKPISKVAPKEAAKAALSCYRLGPFIDHNSLASARRKLENSGIRYRVEEDNNAKNIKAVRVYLATESSPKALDAARKRLKQMNIKHFVIKVNGVQLVQLGYFSEPARAAMFQKTLKSRGVEALTETIYRKTRIKSWLDLQLASNELVASLKLSAPARAKEQACK